MTDELETLLDRIGVFDADLRAEARADPERALTFARFVDAATPADRGVNVVELPVRITADELAHRMSSPLGRVVGLLEHLEANGYAERDGGNFWRLPASLVALLCEGTLP